MSSHKTPRTSVSKSGSTKLVGDVLLAEGTNITLTQTEQTITIAASGGGSAKEKEYGH